MNRRRALKMMAKGGIPLGVLAGAGFTGARLFLPPGPSAHLDSVDTLAARFVASLEPGLRQRVQVDYNHPLRQYHNRGVSGGGVGISSWHFSRRQRSILTDLMHAGLSQAGQRRLPHQFFINWPGVHLMRIVVCGEPASGPYQVILTGPHLNLRLGGASDEGVAFGGPQVYGDQRGDERPGLPGNVYRYQFLTAQQLFRSLEPASRQAALLPRAPIQTRIEIQGRRGAFPGLPLAEAAPASRDLARELVEGVLSTYAPADAAHAWRCLQENGGLEALHLSYYEDGEVGGSGEYQIFRLEGPAAVLHFRGYPHVHAFINIAMDPERPLSVGEVVGHNPRVLESGGVKALFERAMRRRTGADLAYYPLGAAVGRLRAGAIRTGDIYTLENWQDFVATVRLPGSAIGGDLRTQVGRSGQTLEDRRLYTVATSGYTARYEAGPALGASASWERHGPIRDAVIDDIRSHGFEAVA